MRNLWELLLRNHVFILFLVLQLLALSWVARSHAYPRGVVVRWNLGMTGAWNQRIMELTEIQRLADENEALVGQNAALRLALSPLGQASSGAEVIRATSSHAANWFIVNRGSLDGVHVDAGVINHRGIVGRIIEVAPEYSLGLPLIHTGHEWSGRVGIDGAFGRVTWDGSRMDSGKMLDIARSARISTGDTILSTGFQGIFPADVPLGVVKRVSQNPDDEFLSVELEWCVDFQALRYVELIEQADLPSFSSSIETEN